MRLYNSVDTLISYHRELSDNDEQFSKALSLLASCEENTGLARTLSKLAETHENLAIAERHIADEDSQQLAEPLQVRLFLTIQKYLQKLKVCFRIKMYPSIAFLHFNHFQEQLQLTNVLKEVFFERVKSWQNWQNQQQMLTKKREVKTRMDLAGRSDKATVYAEELKDCENRADQLERDFLTMSRVIREEYDRYCRQRREDIKNALINHLESLLEGEQRVSIHLKSFILKSRNLKAAKNRSAHHNPATFYQFIKIIKNFLEVKFLFQVLEYWEKFAPETKV